MLPDYLAKAVPNPKGNRAPWYANTAPSYAGIFLWVAFYKSDVGRHPCSTADWACACWPCWWPGSSATALLPGPGHAGDADRLSALRGGQLDVRHGGRLHHAGLADGPAANRLVRGGDLRRPATSSSRPSGRTSGPGSVPFIVTGAIWGLDAVLRGRQGHPVRRQDRDLSELHSAADAARRAVPDRRAECGSYTVPPGRRIRTWRFTTMIAIVIGFFATAGAAGADFGMNSRDEKRRRMGRPGGDLAGRADCRRAAADRGRGRARHGSDAGLGLRRRDPGTSAGRSRRSMFLLFAVASVPPTCFCAFIAGNSFNTMIPSVPRVASTMAGAVVGIILAVTGVAANLIAFFNIVGASFGPICGAMAADYLLSGRNWSRTARRRESGGLRRVGGGLHRGDSAVPADCSRRTIKPYVSRPCSTASSRGSWCTSPWPRRACNRRVCRCRRRRWRRFRFRDRPGACPMLLPW